MTSAKEVGEALRGVLDPELGIDIVSLGLVYRIETQDSAIGVQISATSEACPMTGLLQSAAWSSLQQAFPGATIAVQLVHDPPWDVAMLDAHARRILGLPPREPR